MNGNRILVVDDELMVNQGCARVLSRSGRRVDTALSPEEATEKLLCQEYEVVFLDIKLVGDGGVKLLEWLDERSPETAVVIILGQASVASAAELMRRGRFQYLPKPFTPDELSVALGRALQQRMMLLQVYRASRDETGLESGDLIGTGPAMRELSLLIDRVAPFGISVLIIGEVGTGKNLVAQTIHRKSRRRLEPFVEVEADLIQELPLVEQIFGRAESRDGAPRYRPGRIEEAGNGTLYIDEITALDLDGQKRLLASINQREFQSVGGKKARPLSCRIIFATYHDLYAEVEQGAFLQEFYRDISVFPIYVPPLSERTEDIPALINHFLRCYSQRYGRSVTRVDEQLLTRLIGRRWPGNVRELARSVEQMVAICEVDKLGPEHYKRVMEDSGGCWWDGKSPITAEELKLIKKLLRQSVVVEVERAFISGALQRSGGNVTRAAHQVGMQRRNFQTMMRQYGIKGGGEPHINGVRL